VAFLVIAFRSTYITEAAFKVMNPVWISSARGDCCCHRHSKQEDSQKDSAVAPMQTFRRPDSSAVVRTNWDWSDRRLGRTPARRA